MPCCKAEKYKWCKDHSVVYKDDKGEEYCVFHAPQGKKGTSVKGFNELIFKKIIFNKAKKNNATCNLDGTVFEGDISFSQFDKDNPLPKISFMRATFSEGANFSGVTFSEDANFSEATFSKEAYFGKTTFSEKAYFAEATFSENVGFGKATFNKDAYFPRAIFSKKTSFFETTFSENAYFWETTFSEETYFRRSTFSKKAEFRGTTFSKKVDFTGLTIAEKVGFEGVNLSIHSFIDTDLTKIDFINCEWPKNHGHNILYDEICLFRNKEEQLQEDEETQEDKKTDGILYRLKQKLKKEWAGFLKDTSCNKERIKKVEILYRQLKRKCKEEHNELDISDWHYGEKEMIRKGKRFRRILSLYSLYWLSSGYGERPTRAGIILICLILLVSVLFGFAGLNPNSNLELKLAPINEIKDIVKNPIEILANTLQYATFEKDTYFMPQNIWGTFLKILTKLFIPLQAALFAFSVRNRFKR